MSISPNLRGTPIPELQKAVLGQNPAIQPYAALAQLNDLVKQQKMQQAMQGQAAMAQNVQQQGPSERDKVLMASAQAQPQGIDTIPTRNMAGGGIVAFAGGGETDMEPFDFPYQSPEEREALRRMMAYRRQQAAMRTAPRAEIPIMSNEDRRSKDAMAAETRSLEGRFPFKATPAGGISALVPPSGPVAGAGPVSRAGAPGGAPGAPGAGSSAGTAAEIAKSLAELRAQEKAAAEGLTMTPDIVAARAARDTSSEEAAKARAEEIKRQRAEVDKFKAQLTKRQSTSPMENAALFAEMAGAAGGKKRFSEALAAAAGAGGKEMTRQQQEMMAQEKEARAMAAGVSQLDIARMDFDTANRQLKVAELTGDRDKIAASKAKFLEAQRHLLDIQSRMYGAQLGAETQVKAARVGSELADRRMAMQEKKQNLEAFKANTNYAGVVAEIKRIMSLANSAGGRNSPDLQQQLKDAQAAGQRLAAKYGLDKSEFQEVLSETLGPAGSTPSAPGAQQLPPGITVERLGR